MVINQNEDWFYEKEKIPTLWFSGCGAKCKKRKRGKCWIPAWKSRDCREDQASLLRSLIKLFHDKPSRHHPFCKSWLVSPGLLVRIPWFKKWANYPKKAPTDPGASKFNQGQYLLSRSCRIYLSFPPFFILIDCHASHKRACLKYNSYISGCFHLIWLLGHEMWKY